MCYLYGYFGVSHHPHIYSISYFAIRLMHALTNTHTHTHICYGAVEAKCHYSNSRFKHFWTTRGSCWIATLFKPVAHSTSLTHTQTHLCTHACKPPSHPISSPCPQNTLKQNLFIHLFIHPIILASSLFERR